MAKKKNTGFTIFISLLTLGLVLTGLASLNNAIDKEEVISNFKDPAESKKNGWFYVSDIKTLKNGDIVTFTSINSVGDNVNFMGSFLEDTKRFQSTLGAYLFVDEEGQIVLHSGSEKLSYFTFGITDNGYYFKYNDQYLTSGYNSGNTLKFTDVLNEYSTFDVSFENGYAVCISGGDKTCNTIKYTSNYFSLYQYNSGNFPYLMKWYGENGPTTY